jgi:class 3 adenylate cyclase/tetratricopeptide (TPR) repeat protein
VLFADLKGSMELLADRDPEEARRILDPVLERMMEAVHRYEGTVNQVMGDGVMAVFGAPLAHEDHGVRACYAALRMQESIKQYAEEVRRAEGVTVQVRVGLNSGEVVVRSIGSDLHMDYTAVGQTTHLAARMEQLATPGSILLTAGTLQLVEGYVQVRSLGPTPVKGLSEPVEVYEVLGAGSTRTRLQAAAARGLTRFVGRDTELETLRQTLERAGSGHGQIVALTGEPGVGKSRLVWEFTHSHRTQGWLVLESGSVSYGKATSWLPVLDLLKAYCGIEAADDLRRMRERLTGKLLTLDPALQPTLSPLLALLDVPVEDTAWQALDPPQRRQRTLDAVKRLLLRESQEQPLLLVCEDLHWIDTETQALLDSLVDRLPTARILLLVNYRPEYEHTWHRKTYYQQLRLDPLPPESADQLLRALVGDDASLVPLKRLLIERTEGNPFFLEESVRTLIETGVLVSELGACRLAKPIESTQVPATVQAVLAARIDRLAPEDKRLLQAAAVIGKDVPYALVEAIAELPEDGLRQGLARLQAAEFVYEAALFPDVEYTFKHALTHEVAYGGLLGERRRALHARIVAVIETLYPDRQAEHVERLAHHAVRAELWDKAIGYLRQAGTKAAARSAHREAVGYLEQAIDAARHLPESQDTCELSIDIRLDLRNPLVVLGEIDQLLDHLCVAESQAEALGDERRLGWTRVNMLGCFWQRGDPQRVIELGEASLAIGKSIADRAMQAHARVRLGNALYSLGNYHESIERSRDNVTALRGAPAQECFGMAGPPVVLSLSYMMAAHAELGEFAEGLATSEAGIQLAEQTMYPFGRVRAAASAAQLHLLQGNIPRAIALLEGALHVAESFDVRVLIPEVLSYQGYAYALAGRVAEGLPLLERAVNDPHTRRFHVELVPKLAEACLLAGRLADAKRMALQAVTLAQDCQERGRKAWIVRLLGEIVAQEGPLNVEQAETYYHEALALADELGMRPLAAHCHLGLGTLYQRVGRDEQARAELATAAELYRAMEMTFWLEKAEGALAKGESTS